jgi:hypothetical protein
MTGKQLTAASALTFLFAGNAKFTLRSTKTGRRYTYRVRRPADAEGTPAGNRWFVSVLTGSDNENDYTYMGMITQDGVFRVTKASKLVMDSPPVKAFTWTLGYIIRLMEPVGVEVWHEGSCGRCGRTLTVPESIESGFGPECIGLVKRPAGRATHAVPNQEVA